MESIQTALTPDPARQLLRHALATVAYRGGKTLREAPESFADFKVSEKSRTPVEILAHIGDLYDWALSLCKDKQEWHNSKPLPWPQEVERFFAALKKLDDYLASDQPLGVPIENLLQGPVADSLTHVGQLAMLRTVAGCKIKRENYFKADIAAGRVGSEQTPPKTESD